MIGRHVLPIHSPVSPSALCRSAAETLFDRSGARTRAGNLLKREYAADDVLLLGSGTHALQLALHAAARRSHGALHVALPGYTCYDVATAAVGANARITLFDVDPRSLAPDLKSVEHALERGARVVVVTPLYGIPVDWDAIEQCAQRYDALVVEDAAQGHGSSWRERKLGSHGRLSVLSFGRGKGWTGGCGGALLARRGVMDEIGALSSIAPPSLGAFAGLARASVQWMLGRNELYGIPASVPWLHLGATRYHEPTPPRAASPVAASLVERSFTLALAESEVRRRNARALIAGLASVVAARPACHLTPIRPNTQGVCGYLRLPMLLRGGLTSVAKRVLAARLGIMPGYPSTLLNLPAVRDRMHGNARPALPGCDELSRDLITLATHSLVTSSDLEAQLRFLRDSCPPVA